MDTDLRAYLERIDSRLDENDRRLEAAAARLDSRFDETRRHFDVVAEGVTTLAERVDRLEHNLQEEIRETRRDLTSLLTASYTDVDRRVRRLEGDR